MADPGFVPGFIGVGIQMAMNQIIRHINIAVSCRKELESLKAMVLSIEPIVRQIQQNRVQTEASAVNEWLTKLDEILRQASKMVRYCTVPRFDFVSRYQTSKKITGLILNIDKHLKLVQLINLAQTQGLHAMQRESAQAASSSASASTSLQVTHATTTGFFIEEALIVGQEEALASLEKSVMADCESLLIIGVLGKGGSGKTLLLRRLFNSQKVQNLVSDNLLLWLTISYPASFPSLRNELCAQIAIQTDVDLDKNMSEGDVKIWLNESMGKKRFALFLDNVWREGGKLLEELGLLRLIDHSNSKIIVSSRDTTALLQMGVAETSTVRMEDLMEKQSWQLFGHHAFPYNNGKPPANIDEETAKLVCANCGGLPLAIKVVGRAMAGITSVQQWKFAIGRVPKVHSSEDQSSDLYKCLRLSYDALDVNLQLCFLYLAAASFKNQILGGNSHAVQLWIGEGLLTTKELQDEAGCDPFEMGRSYLDSLADRCLIEPIARDLEGRVLWFRIHDVLYDLAIQIADRQENCYFRPGRGLTELRENECSAFTRISLNYNKLSSLPKSFRAPEICSLLLRNNKDFAEIPKRVLGRMTSLKVLDLSWTSLHSLPDSLGCLKQLVCLRLAGAPLRRLPASATNLVSLQTLDLSHSSIEELPSCLHRLTSLRILLLNHCKNLSCLPSSISRVTSLQYLHMKGCGGLWTKRLQKRSQNAVASISHLGNLNQLRSLKLQNNGETINEGLFGCMTQMETLVLILTKMGSLPSDMTNMSQLRRLKIKSSHLVKIEPAFCAFQNLISLTLVDCEKLEQLPTLEKLEKLRQLEIIKCPMIKKLPIEFGERGAFRKLQILSLIDLNGLEELPPLHEGSMLSLKIFTMMQCEALKRLSKSYLNLKTVEKIRIFGCSLILENLEKVTTPNQNINIVTLSTKDTEDFREKYLNVRKDSWIYDELWCNELFIVLRELEIL